MAPNAGTAGEEIPSGSTQPALQKQSEECGVCFHPPLPWRRETGRRKRKEMGGKGIGKREWKGGGRGEERGGEGKGNEGEEKEEEGEGRQGMNRTKGTGEKRKGGREGGEKRGS